MRQSDYHAYFATRTHVLDVHVSRMTDGQESFPREEFERIVRSVRVLLLRRGWKEDYPNEVAVPMTLASILGVDQKQWTESYFVKHAEEWPTNFANAEFLHYLKAPLERQLAAYDKALALIAKLEKPDAKVRFAAAMLHEGRGLALYDAKRYDDSIAPQAEGYKILSEIGRKERGALAYNLACSHALAKHREPALEFLKKAVEVDPRFRESAAKDADFATLAGDAEFKKLIAPPAPAPPLKKD
jgi:tetratricopeptide (TPR) repeat protein